MLVFEHGEVCADEVQRPEPAAVDDGRLALVVVECAISTPASQPGWCVPSRNNMGKPLRRDGRLRRREIAGDAVRRGEPVAWMAVSSCAEVQGRLAGVVGLQTGGPQAGHRRDRGGRGNRVELFRLSCGADYWLRLEQFGPDNQQTARAWEKVTPVVPDGFRRDATALFHRSGNEIVPEPFAAPAHIVGAWFPPPGETFGPVANPAGGPLTAEVLAYIGSSNPA